MTTSLDVARAIKRALEDEHAIEDPEEWIRDAAMLLQVAASVIERLELERTELRKELDFRS